MIFPSTCGTCSAYCKTRMFVTRIPYFHEVIVMASTWMPMVTAILSCSLVGGFLKKEKRLLCVKKIKDLNRDVIKSDSASVEVPELDLELAIVTTVEGLITKISESLESMDFLLLRLSRLLAILLGGLQQKRMEVGSLVWLQFDKVECVKFEASFMSERATFLLSSIGLLGEYCPTSRKKSRHSSHIVGCMHLGLSGAYNIHCSGCQFMRPLSGKGGFLKDRDITAAYLCSF